jgi:hypothetical protein
MSEKENNSIAVSEASGSVRRVVRNTMHRWVLALAALAALVFVPAGSSRAQSQTPASKTVVAGAGVSAEATATNLATAPQAASAKIVADSTASAGQSVPQGRHEGITVHGHWSIEVRNTDGTLASRQAFDNELMDSGAQLLGNLLSGTVSPAGWGLHIFGTNPTQVPASQPGPCGAGAMSLNGTAFGFVPNPGTVFCSLYEAGTSSGAAICSQGIPTTFCTLTRTPAIGTAVIANSGKVAITLSGTFPALNPGYVGGVASDLLICMGNLPTSNAGLASYSASTCMTGLPAGEFGETNFFTGTLLSSPVQITAGGQTVAVTLTLSFQ